MRWNAMGMLLLLGAGACARTGTDQAIAGAATGFPSFEPNHGPPPGWTGPVFQLSQNYPTAIPTGDSLPWLKYDFRTDPKGYLMAIRAYAYAGNINRGNDSAGNSLDWHTQTNPVRVWYNMPWRHYGTNGREFIHGLTMEFNSKPHYLDPNQSDTAHTWARGMYNPTAAYTLGQVWPNPNGPSDSSKATFLEGALIIKLLFTTADSTQVPEVKGAYTWDADIYTGATCDSCARAVQPVRLIQMDVAVKDSRAPKTAWVFGTFVYDWDEPGATVWDKMVPLGLMWGNDPEVNSSMTNPVLKESNIFKDVTVRLPEHLGCNGRLSGPLDNPVSSCMSCHMGAQAPQSHGFPVVTDSIKCDSPQNARFWQDLPGSEAFDTTAGVKALDYSMEMASSIQNYLLAHKDVSFSPDGKTFTVKGSALIHHVVRRE